MAKFSPFFANFIGAAIVLIGLLAVVALFGEWGLYIGLIIIIGGVLGNIITSGRHRRRANINKK
jgi:hypothetical protein